MTGPVVVKELAPVGLHHGRNRAREQAEQLGGRFELGPQGFVVIAPVSVKAFETLEEAQQACLDILAADPDANGTLVATVRAFDIVMDPPAGHPASCTLGPLRDGREITVERVADDFLYDELERLGVGWADWWDDRDAIADFNRVMAERYTAQGNQASVDRRDCGPARSTEGGETR